MMRARTAIVFASGITMGCTALIGVRDIYLDENAEGGASSSSGAASSSGASSGASGSSGADGSSGGDGAACNADLNTDPKNCGRCGRDCLGGACTGGRCEPVTLASSLMNPTSAVSYGDNLIVTSYGDGRILEVPKAGGNVRVVLSTGITSPWGGFIVGSTLYFADSDYQWNGTDLSRRGGIWKCELPACASPVLVTAADQPVNPALANGVIYFAENNNDEIIRVLPDGGGRASLDITNNPWSVAVDSTHVYYTSSQPSFYRIPLPDGGGEVAGPQGIYAVGTVAVDEQRYYYSYTQDSNQQAPGSGHVISFTKNAAGQNKIEYGTDNVTPRGLVVDDKYIYWANSGTWDEIQGAPTKFDGQIRACPKTGCPASGPIVLATGLGRPWEMAQDATAIYVCVYGNYKQTGGAVLKIAKL